MKRLFLSMLLMTVWMSCQESYAATVVESVPVYAINGASVIDNFFIVAEPYNPDSDSERLSYKNAKNIKEWVDNKKVHYYLFKGNVPTELQ